MTEIATPEHARLGCSNPRWRVCAGSVREEAKYEDISGASAIDGTGSHLLLELCLQRGVRATAYDRQVIGANHKDQRNGWLVDAERCERVQLCLDYIQGRCKVLRQKYPGCSVTVTTETISNPGELFGRDDWWGTCDVTITVANTHKAIQFVEVIDYKDGRVFVPAKDNSQLSDYLFGKIKDTIDHEFKIRVTHDCQMTICQPRTSPPVRSDTIEHDVLIARMRDYNVAAIATDAPDAPLVPDGKGGKGYCRWCKHKPNCKAQAEQDIGNLKEMTTSTEVAETPLDISNGDRLDLFSLSSNLVENPESMDITTLTKLADMESGITSIFSAAKAEIQRRAVKGDPTPGWKMKPGNASKVWNEDEKKIESKLKSRKLTKADIYPAKLISPAQILKHPKLNKEQIARIEKDLISYTVGDDRLVRVTAEEEADDLAKAQEMFKGNTIEHEPDLDDFDFMTAPATTAADDLDFF